MIAFVRNEMFLKPLQHTRYYITKRAIHSVNCPFVSNLGNYLLRAARVRGPTNPVAGIPCAVWYAFTEAKVIGPKNPVDVGNLKNPSARSLFWSSVTSFPDIPNLRLRVNTKVLAPRTFPIGFVEVATVEVALIANRR